MINYFNAAGELAGSVETPFEFETFNTEGEFTPDQEQWMAWWKNDRLVSGIREEAQRRIMEAVGARDPAHLAIKLSNAQREGLRLLKIGKSSWTAKQKARAQELELSDAYIEAIRDASNTMEKDPPEDFTNPKHWPSSK